MHARIPEDSAAVSCARVNVQAFILPAALEMTSTMLEMTYLSPRTSIFALGGAI